MKAIWHTAVVLVLAAACASHSHAPTATPAAVVSADTGVARLREDARKLEPLVEAPWVKAFVRAAESLPTVAPRTITIDGKERTLDEEYYYNTKYGTPLAYARPFDVLARAGLAEVRGKRVFDFGYGGIGQLRLLALLGAHAVGLDVDPVLAALYAAPGDQGAIGEGSVRLVNGRFAADATATAQVKGGGPYDVIIAKNVLKNGFFHPTEKVDPRTTIDLGVDETTFLAALHDALAPGGRLLIYNITPAPNAPGRPYRTWADGRCPFSRAQLEGAGFRVVTIDEDDTRAVRAMAHALGWDQGEEAMNLKDDLFAHYTLLERAP